MEKEEKNETQIISENNRVDKFLTEAEEALTKRLKNYRMVAYIVYILYILSFFSGITGIIGVILAYIYRAQLPPDEKILYDHFTWQIKTFWILFGAAIISIALSFTIVVPFIVMPTGIVWSIYRVIKGWSFLTKNERLYNN